MKKFFEEVSATLNVGQVVMETCRPGHFYWKMFHSSGMSPSLRLTHIIKPSTFISEEMENTFVWVTILNNDNTYIDGTIWRETISDRGKYLTRTLVADPNNYYCNLDVSSHPNVLGERQYMVFSREKQGFVFLGLFKFESLTNNEGKIAVICRRIKSKFTYKLKIKIYK